MPNENPSPDASAAVGIIMLDTSFPRIPGDIGCPETFSFPVIYEVVSGATPNRVVMEGDPTLLQPFLEAARRLEKRGARALATSCGFLALFHRELVEAVEIPVFSSSLLLIPLARSVIRKNRRVGVLTAHAPSLTEKHLEAAGVSPKDVVIRGMEHSEEFRSVFLEDKKTLDVSLCGREVVDAASRLVAEHPDVGALVLECTNMPPYSRAIRRKTGLPVFDAVTLVKLVHDTVAGTPSIQAISR